MIDSKRLVYIDIAKGFAILCVVFGHILCYDLYGFEKAWADSNLMKVIYRFHMPLFVFLSGLVSPISVEAKSIPADLWKRFRTILVPGIIIGSIYSLSFSGNLLFIYHDMKFGYWYLWVLFFYYILLYGINVSLKRIGGGNSSVLVLSLLLIIWWMSHHEYQSIPINIRKAFSVDLIVAYFPYFMIGNSIKRFRLQKKVFEDSRIFLLSFIFLMCSSLFLFSLLNYFAITASIIIIIHICKIIEKEYAKLSIWMSYLGTQTLYIYVFHYFALQGFKTTYFYDLLPRYSNICWDFLLCIPPAVLCVIFSLFIGKITESSPIVEKYVFGKKIANRS